MSKKLTVFELHCMVMASPYCLKVLTISFFFLSIIGFEIPRKVLRPSSRYKPMSFLSITDLSCLRIKEPTSSQISSKHIRNQTETNSAKSTLRQRRSPPS